MFGFIAPRSIIVAVLLASIGTPLTHGDTVAPAAPPESRPGVEDDQSQAESADQDRPTTSFTGTAEVVASRLAAEPVRAGRLEIVLIREEIEKLPVQTVQDLLAVIPGVGLARRGARGVQGDLNLRGGTFEQALVLLNGVRVSNPQTGHHNLDLFVPLQAIERIEVLYGPGSAVHGPDAFGGAINIVTAAPPVSALVRVGENDLAGGVVAGSLSNGLWAALEREVHTGFRDNTEADVNQGAAGWSWSDGRSAVDLTFAAGRRRFGAHAFYSSRYPDQHEETAGRVLTVGARTPAGATTVGIALRLDQHDDDFVLDRDRPEWYRNVHETEGALLDLSLTGAISGWDWVVGAELARDEIDSSNLGRHHRSRTAGFAELGRFHGPLTYALQLRADHHEGWGWVRTLALGGSWEMAPGLRLRAHWGQSFRAPSFTDLYYSSPATVGNSELLPEEGQTFEVGVDGGPWTVSVFDRRADTLIDYLLDEDGVWHATNLGGLRTRGLEASVLFPGRGRLLWQRAGFVVLDSELDVDPLRSRYALAHPRTEAAWTGALAIAKAWQAGWALRFRDPANGGSWATVDLQVAWRLPRGLRLAVEGSNIFDQEISELHGVPLPGRWLSMSLQYRGEDS